MYRKIFRSWRTVVAISIVILALFYVSFAYEFLSKSHPVAAEILVVEGWLPDYALDQACDEFKRNKYRLLITTGFPHERGVIMAADGMFEFDMQNRIKPSPENTYEIAVQLRGTPSKGAYAHFSLQADSVPLIQQFSERQVKEYSYTVQQSTPPARIQVIFDNDAFSKNTDRNLYVYAVSVNSQTFPANDPSVNYYGWNGSHYEFRRKLAAGSAGEAAGYMISKGIADTAVVAVETSASKWSKTYATALDVRNWLMENRKGQALSANIFSHGPHARRTWISYRKVFKGYGHTGIIACAHEEIRRGNWWKTKNGWRLILYETAGFLLVKILL
jgi:hypothetical protein